MKLFKIISVILIIITVGFILTLIFDSNEQDTTEQEYFFEPADVIVDSSEVRNQYPDGTADSGRVQLDVDIFLNDGITFEDPMNPGQYVLSGDLGYCTEKGVCLNNAEINSFIATFDSSDNYFNIILLSNPLPMARTDAERFMQEKLAVSRTELCNLNYTIIAPYWVNEEFAGQDLRFSFCSDAISL